MTLPDLSTSRDAVLEPAKDGATATLKPHGLDDDEWALVREHRAQKAAEERRALAADLPRVERSRRQRRYDDWDAAARRFVTRAEALGWSEEETSDFIAGLMREDGFTEATIQRPRPRLEANLRRREMGEARPRRDAPIELERWRPATRSASLRRCRGKACSRGWRSRSWPMATEGRQPTMGEAKRRGDRGSPGHEKSRRGATNAAAAHQAPIPKKSATTTVAGRREPSMGACRKSAAGALIPPAAP